MALRFTGSHPTRTQFTMIQKIPNLRATAINWKNATSAESEMFHHVIIVTIKIFEINLVLNLSMVLDLPLALSQPHFYKSDPLLLDQFDGLNPVKESHETKIAVQPVSFGKKTF